MTTVEDGTPAPEAGLRFQLMRIRYDLTAAQAKLTDVFALVDLLGVDDERRRASFMNGPVLADSCESCGIGAGEHADGCEAA